MGRHSKPAPVLPPWLTDGETPRTTTRLASIGIATALLLASLGGGFVGMAVASQRSPASPPAPVRAAEGAPGRDVEGWQARSLPTAVTGPQDVPPKRPTAPPPPPAPTAAPEPRPLGRSVPLSLDIPAIGVRSELRTVGQADDGSVETPQPGPYYNDAAWYRYSPTPGSIGPAILLGHVDSAAEGPSVFFRLGELAAGDRVAVTRADGSAAVFRVDRVRRYAKDRFPTELVYGDIDHAGLRLVTCGGAFDNSSGHYLDNVVVFASLVDTH